VARSPFGLFDWYLKPHLNSRGFPIRTRAWFERAAAKLDCPVYAIDDDSAVRVRGDEIDVVSDGRWLLLNAEAPQTAGPGHQQAPRPRVSLRLPAVRRPRWVMRLTRLLGPQREAGLRRPGMRLALPGVIRYSCIIGLVPI
jgi:hypothetical protein